MAYVRSFCHPTHIASLPPTLPSHSPKTPVPRSCKDTRPTFKRHCMLTQVLSRSARMGSPRLCPGNLAHPEVWEISTSTNTRQLAGSMFLQQHAKSPCLLVSSQPTAPAAYHAPIDAHTHTHTPCTPGHTTHRIPSSDTPTQRQQILMCAHLKHKQ